MSTPRNYLSLLWSLLVNNCNVRKNSYNYTTMSHPWVEQVIVKWSELGETFFCNSLVFSGHSGHIEWVPLSFNPEERWLAEKCDSYENYHGISLLSILGNVFIKIKQLTLQKHCKQTNQEKHTSFRPYWDYINQILTTHQPGVEKDQVWKVNRHCFHWLQINIQL